MNLNEHYLIGATWKKPESFYEKFDIKGSQQKP